VRGLFTSINAEVDAVPFESGNNRQSYLAARDRIRRWLPTLRTVYLLELPLAETRMASDLEIDQRFYQALSDALNHIANCLNNQLEDVKCDDPADEITTDRRSWSLAILQQDGGVSSSLSLLATNVDNLERDVSSEPVFAP
jgi:hypothetical protein